MYDDAGEVRTHACRAQEENNDRKIKEENNNDGDEK